MFPYLRTVQGRLLALALALPLVAGAIIPFNAEGIGDYALPIVCGIGLAFVAMGLSVDEYPGAALMGALALPVAIFLYIPLVGIVVPHVHSVVYVMAMTACVLLAIAARPGLPAAPKSDVRLPRVA